MSKAAPAINKLVVIGTGLIGGSLAIGLKKRNLCQEVIGISRSQASADSAIKHGVVDRAFLALSDIASELAAADLIFISVPTLSMKNIFQDIQRFVTPEVTITDGASVKGSVEAAAIDVFGEMPPQLVLGHPIAGSEKSGVTAANPDLYEQHRVIVTPDANTSAEHLARVTQMWQGLGAQVLSMPIAEHDEVLSATSHLPHAIAYSLVDTLAHDITNPNIFRYAAGGFRDFTRIASSDPVMWHDIMRANKACVLHAMDMFLDNLAHLRSAIESDDSEHLLKVFSRAKEARDKLTILQTQDDR